MAGTESLTLVFYKGEYRIAHYARYDGYPECRGLITLEFIRDKMNYGKFTDKLMKLRELSDADIDRAFDDGKFELQYPHLTEGGLEILSTVQDGEDGLPVKSLLNLASNSRWCKWAYVIDFDKGTFEVYRGFNHEKLDPSERFANAEVAEGSDYRPIKFVTSWRLDMLPTNETFLLELAAPHRRLVYLISEAELVCDKEGIDTFLDRYFPQWVEETVAAFAEVGAAEIAMGLRAIATNMVRDDSLLSRVNELIRSRTGYDSQTIRKAVDLRLAERSP